MNTNSFSTAIKGFSILLVALLFSVGAYAQPATPSAPTATTVSLTSAVVTFTASSLNGGTPSNPEFTITPYLSGVAGTPVTCNSSPCLITGLTSGGSYTFKVQESSNAGTSAASSASTAITLAAAATPNAPTSVVASLVTSTSAVVQFTAPTTAVGTIISYTVTATTGGQTATISLANGNSIPQAGAGNGAILITGLTSNTTFTVTSNNGTASAASTASSSLTLTTPTAATVPLNPIANIASISSAYVYFNVPTSASGSTTLYGYTIKAYTTSGNTLTQTAYATTSPAFVSGLTNGVSYYFTVSAAIGSASINSNSITMGTVATNTFSLAGTSQASPGDWNTAANWSAGHVPTSNENVTIPGGFFVINNATAVANSITISSSAASATSIGYLKNSSTGTLTVIQNYSTAISSIYLNAANASYYGAIFDNEGTFNVANFANGNIGCVGFNYAPDYTGSNPDYRNDFIANGTINVYSSECSFFCSVSTSPTVGVGELTGSGTINFGAPVSGGGYSASSATNGSFISPFLLKGGYTYIASSVTIKEYFYSSNTGQLVYQNSGSFTNNGSIYLIGATYNSAAYSTGKLATGWNLANGSGLTLNWTNNGTFAFAGLDNGGSCLSSSSTGTFTDLANCNITNSSTGTIYLNTATIPGCTINTIGTGNPILTNGNANVIISNSGTLNMGGASGPTTAFSFTTSAYNSTYYVNQTLANTGTINLYGTTSLATGNWFNNGYIAGNAPSINNNTNGIINFNYSSTGYPIIQTTSTYAAQVVPTLYNAGQVIVNASGVYQLCTTAGTSTTTAPTFSSTIGTASSGGGTAVFKCIGNTTTPPPSNTGAFVPSTAYTLGQIVTNGVYQYICTIAGTSGTAPTWPTTLGTTVTSGGSTFACSLGLPNVTAYSSGVAYVYGQLISNGGYLYEVTVAGTSTTTAPSATTPGSTTAAGATYTCISTYTSSTIPTYSNGATAYVQNQLVLDPNGYPYRVTIAGTSAAGTPSWPSTPPPGTIVTTGGVTFTCALSSVSNILQINNNGGTIAGYNTTFYEGTLVTSNTNTNVTTLGTLSPTANGANGTVTMTLPQSCVLYGTLSPQLSGANCGTLGGASINLSNATLAYTNNSPTLGTNFEIVNGSPNTGNFVFASAPTNSTPTAETGVTTATAATANTGYVYTTSATTFKSQYLTTPSSPVVSSATLSPGNGSVTVGFAVPSSNGGGIGVGLSGGNGYTVTATGTDGPDNGNSYTAQGNTTSVAVTGLTYGTDYSFTVTAANFAGTSAAAAVSGTAQPSNNAPGLPAVNSVVNGDGVALISFTGPSSDGAGATNSLTYTITAATGGFSTTIGPNTTTTAQTVLATGLGASNTVTITVTNSNGYTSYITTPTTSTNNISFLGTVDNTWENALNWTANTLPTSSDNVTITNNAVTIASGDVTAVANTITISPSSTGSLANAGTLTVTAGITLSGSGTASLSNSGTLSATTLGVSATTGSVSNTGTFSVTDVTLSSTGASLNNNSGGKTFSANSITLGSGTSATNTGGTMTINTVTASKSSISLTDASFDNEGTLNVTTASANCVSIAGSASGSNSFTANGTNNFTSTTAGKYVFASTGTDAVNILGAGFQIGTSTSGVSTGILSSTGAATITIGSSGNLNGTVITEYFVYTTGTGYGINLTAGTLNNYGNLTIEQSTTTSTVSVYPVYLASQGSSLPIAYNNYGTLTSVANGTGNAIGIYLAETVSGGTINVTNETGGNISMAVTYCILVNPNLNTTITNAGTMSLVTSGSVTVYSCIEFNSSSNNTLQFNNTGTLNLQAAAGGGRSIYFSSNPLASPNIANTGTINITAGPIDYSTTTGMAGTINNNGGGIINFNYSSSTAAFYAYSGGTVVPILTNSGGTIAGYNVTLAASPNFVSSTGTLAPQYSASGNAITLASGYSLTGTLAPQILSASHYGQLVAPSLVATSAALSIIPTSYTPTAGTAFNLVNWTSGSTTFSSITSAWGANYSGSNIVATYYTVPGAPSSVVGTPGDGTVSVAFSETSNGGGVTSYTVTPYDATTSTTLSTVSGASSPISVSGLTDGDSYTFTVTATNPAGTSSASAASSAVSPANTSPAAPTVSSTNAAVAGDGVALVSFTGSATYGAGATSIAYYTVTSIPGGFTGTGSSSPIQVSGLTNGTAYTFTVTATNDAAIPASATSGASNSVTPSTTITWNGNAGDGLWATGNNWTGGSVPNANDNVIIGNHAVSIGGSVTAAANTVTLNASGGSITNSGSLTISGATGTTTNSLTITSGTTVTNNGTLSITAAVAGYAGVYMSGGTFTSSTSTLSITTSSSNTAATGSCIYALSGTNTINISGGSLVAGNTTNALNALCVAGGTTTLGGTGFTIGTSAASGVSYRLFQISAATLIINSTVNLTAYYDGYYQYSTPIYISGASTLTNNGNITLTPTTTLPYGFYGMSVAVANNTTVTFNNNGSYIYNGAYQGMISSASGTITTAGTYNVNNTGTIQMNGNGGGSGFVLNTPVNFGLTNSGTVTINCGNAITGQVGSQTQVVSTGTLTNTGTITINKGAIGVAYRTGDNPFTINNNTGGTINFNYSSGTTALNGTPTGTGFSASTIYSTVGTLITVSGSLYEVTTAGTAAEAAPSWNTTVGSTSAQTTGGATFTCLALPTAPVLNNNGGKVTGYNCTFATSTLVTNTATLGTIAPSANGSGVGTITLPTGYTLYGTFAPKITSASAYGQLIAPSLVGTHATLTLSPGYSPSTTTPTVFNLVNNNTTISSPTSFSNSQSSPWVVNYSNGDYITATYATVPGAPTIGTAVDGDAQATISFTAPSNNGGTSITSYTVTSSPGGKTASGTTSPITVTGLSNGTTYTFTVIATNIIGTSTASAASNAVTPSTVTTWNGTTWSAGVPNSASNAIINGNITMAQWGSATSVNYLTVNSPYTFALTGIVTINNDAQTAFTNNGTISGGTIVLGGTIGAQTIAGTGLVNNLTVNNSNGVTVSSGSNNLGVTGVLTLQSGTLTTNGNVTLKSLSITNSGVFAPYQTSGNTGTISGNVTVERYIPAGYRAYRDLGAAGIYASGNTLYNTWQESGSYTHSGYGLFITGATSTAGSSYSSNHVDNGTGGTYLDYSLNSYPSASYWNTTNQSWSTVTNTNTTALNPFQSYRVLVRGDRGFDLYTTPIINYPNGLRMYDATTLRTTGSLIYGNVTYTPSGVANSVTGSAYTSSTYGLSSASNGYTYIANPYDCPIDFHNIFSNSRITNMIDGYWYLDPTIGATGSYVAYNAVANVTNTGYANGNLIQAGQGFLVANYNSTSPSLEITEADKVASSSKTYVFGAEAPTSKLFVGLLKESTRVDGVAVVFGNNFSNGLGLEDSRKLSSGTDNLAIKEGGNYLSIDGRLPATASDVLGIYIGQPSTTNYQLRIDASGYINNGYAPLLYDAYKNTTRAISGIDSVSFTLDTSITASYENRFSIIFTPSALAVNSIVASATLNNKVATITWNTVGEKGESYFEVEKSIDGKNFTAIGQQAAKNTSTASYTATDNSVVEGNNYYRIKAVSETGSVNYSNVAKVQLTVNSNQFTVYPNPLVGKTLNVSLGNVAAGKYVVSIYNVLGEKVNEQTISHSGGSATHAITINNTLAGGVYSLVIREASSNQIVHQASISVQP